MFLKGLKRSLAIKFGAILSSVQGRIASATLPEFGNEPKNLKIDMPRRISHPECMFLGDDIRIGPGSLLIAVTKYPGPTMQHPAKNATPRHFTPRITIGNRVTATAGLQVASMSEITIGDDVMFASNINITDGLHGYGNPYEPYKYQEMTRVEPIRINRGCWIGQNVVILPGVTIGEFSIIGANSVVTRSVPARCIAVGAPARIIREWDGMKETWVSCSREGTGVCG